MNSMTTTAMITRPGFEHKKPRTVSSQQPSHLKASAFDSDELWRQLGRR